MTLNLFHWLDALCCVHHKVEARDGRRWYLKCLHCHWESKGILIGKPANVIQLPSVSRSGRQGGRRKGEAA